MTILDFTKKKKIIALVDLLGDTAYIVRTSIFSY